jgi:hypothetical protein
VEQAQVREDRAHHGRALQRGDEPQPAAAARARKHVDPEGAPSARALDRALQVQRQSGHTPARSTVTVCEWEDGQLMMEYRGQPMRWTEITGRRPALVGTGAVRRPHRPRADHPWRHGVEAFRQHKTLWQTMKH